MDNAIHVGNKIDKETADNVAGGIVSILKAGHESRAEQDTIVEAIRALSSVMEVKHVTITNSNFTGDKIVNMNDED
jgi:hypothetical protein